MVFSCCFVSLVVAANEGKLRSVGPEVIHELQGLFIFINSCAKALDGGHNVNII